jgi:hypothetical protein
MPEARPLEACIAALEDIEAIRTLKWRYLRACDWKRPEDVRDCFLPEATIHYQDQGLPPFADRDEFVAFCAEHGGMRGDIFEMHHGQNPVIELTRTDAAVGTFDLYYHGIDTTARTLTQMGVAYGRVRASRRALVDLPHGGAHAGDAGAADRRTGRSARSARVGPPDPRLPHAAE